MWFADVGDVNRLLYVLPVRDPYGKTRHNKGGDPEKTSDKDADKGCTICMAAVIAVALALREVLNAFLIEERERSRNGMALCWVSFVYLLLLLLLLLCE